MAYFGEVSSLVLLFFGLPILIWLAIRQHFVWWLVVPLWVWFWGNVVLEWFADGVDTPGDWFFTNAWNSFLHIPPVFKWWGFILYLLMVGAFVIWRKVPETSLADRLTAVSVPVISLFLVACGLGSIDYGNAGTDEALASMQGPDELTEDDFVCRVDPSNSTAMILNATAADFGDHDVTYLWEVHGPDDTVFNTVPDQGEGDGEIRPIRLTSLNIEKSGDYSCSLKVVSEKDDIATDEVIGDEVVRFNIESEPPEPPPTRDCDDTWRMLDVQHPDGRFAGAGVVQIGYAETDEEAREAVLQLVDRIKVDPSWLSGAVRYVLDMTAPNPHDLVDEFGCATASAVDYADWIEDALQNAISVTAEDAPSNGCNSGVDEEGRVVVARTCGLSGDLTAIKIVLDDGRELWILARCGNFVTLEAPEGLPTGPTDQEVIVVSESPSEETTTTTQETTAPEEQTEEETSPPPSGKTAEPLPTDAPDPADRGNVPPPADNGQAAPAPAPAGQQTEDPPPAEVSDPSPAPTASQDAGQVDCDQDNNGIPDEGCG